MKELVRKTVRVLAVLVIIAASCYLAVEWKGNHDNRMLYENMKKEPESQAADGEEADRKPGRNFDLEALMERNPDCIGEVEIPGTDIVYPVVFTSREDGLYYLKRNFDREADARGSIFMDFRCDPEKPSTNLILYGHRMRNGQMFGQLREYRSEEFLKNHPVIYYTDLQGTRTYRIFAVVLSDDPSQMDLTARKYQYEFTDADSQEEIREFCSFMKKRSLHPAGEAAEKALEKTTEISMEKHVEGGAEFLTLRTCDYAMYNGRLSVVAVRVDEEEQP